MGEWMNLGVLYITEYYIAIRKHEIMQFSATIYGAERYHFKQNKPEEGQILDAITHLWYIEKQNKRRKSIK